MSNCKLLVYGIVQNVGFRHNVYLIANKLKIKGFVKNLPNNLVEIYCQGADDSLNKLLDFVKSNPGYSKVDRIELKSAGDSKKFDSFKILY